MRSQQRAGLLPSGAAHPHGVLLQLARLLLAAEAQRVVDGLHVPLHLLRTEIAFAPLKLCMGTSQPP